MPRYAELVDQLRAVRPLLGDRPLTLAEKILYTHLLDPQADLAGAGKDASAIRGSRYLKLKIDRLAMQDASAQMALLQFMTCGLAQVAVPASVHCDHLIQAYEGAAVDLQRAGLTLNVREYFMLRMIVGIGVAMVGFIISPIPGVW